MSNSVVMAVQAPFQNAFSLVKGYIDLCPEEIWKETSGGWPIWQQLYHTLATLDFFVATATYMAVSSGMPPLAPFDINVGGLTQVSTDTMSKEAMHTFADSAKLRVDAYIATLSDADLASPNADLSQRLGRAIPHGTVLGMLASHTLYHLGSCDAALRNQGLKGVY